MTYADLKALIAKKNLTWQYEDTPMVRRVFAYDGPLLLETKIFTGDPSWPDGFTDERKAAELANLADFNVNHETASNWAIGERPYPFATGDFDFARDGVFDIVTSDEFDLWLKIWDTGLYLNGGFMYCGVGFSFGTWAEMAIVDKDGEYYPAGTVLKSWVRRSYPAPDGKCDVTTPYAGNPPVNTYLRVRVHRKDPVDFPVAINFNIHKAI